MTEAEKTDVAHVVFDSTIRGTRLEMRWRDSSSRAVEYFVNGRKIEQHDYDRVVASLRAAVADR